MLFKYERSAALIIVWKIWSTSRLVLVFDTVVFLEKTNKWTKKSVDGCNRYCKKNEPLTKGAVSTYLRLFGKLDLAFLMDIMLLDLEIVNQDTAFSRYGHLRLRSSSFAAAIKNIFMNGTEFYSPSCYYMNSRGAILLRDSYMFQYVLRVEVILCDQIDMVFTRVQAVVDYIEKFWSIFCV